MRSLAVAAVLSLAATGLVGCACPKPPPNVAAPVCPEPEAQECPKQKTKVVRVKADCDCPELGKAPVRVEVRDRTAPQTCAYGKVITAGDMVLSVKRAEVTLSAGSGKASSFTDENGVFVVCIDSARLSAGGKLTVSVSKPPFVPASRTVDTPIGQHFEVLFRVRAPGLTD